MVELLQKTNAIQHKGLYHKAAKGHRFLNELIAAEKQESTDALLQNETELEDLSRCENNIRLLPNDIKPIF